MAHKKLLIAIPTYNRKKQLIRLLKSIEIQRCTELYDIIISDNCSDYSIYEIISETFNKEFVDNIHIVRREFNAGGDRNISSLFSYANKYDLLWTIGDDDEVTANSINDIIFEFEKNPDIAFFKYSILQNSGPKTNQVLRSVSDLEKSKRAGYCNAGDLIFLSNNVYNVSLLRNYLPDCQYYSYCSVSQILPMMRCLVEESFPVMLCQKAIVKYNPPEGDAWNYVKIATSFGTFADIQWNDNHKDTMKCLNMLSAHFGIGRFLLYCIDMKDKSYRNYVCHKARITIFNRPKSLTDWFAIIAYNAEILLYIPVFSFLYKNLFYFQENMKQKIKDKAKTDPKFEKIKLILKKHLPKMS